VNNMYANTGIAPKYVIAGIDHVEKMRRARVPLDVGWMFPLSFVEVVWGDGKKIDRQIIKATDTCAFATKKFSITFDAAGKACVPLLRCSNGAQHISAVA
jgi:hypothetical protein